MATLRELVRAAELTVKDKTSGRRIRQIVSVLNRHDVRHGVSPEKVAAILEELGPTYVKMGQIASSRSDLLPEEYCEAFGRLRADVAPLPFPEVAAALERSLGKPLGEVFSHVEEQPLGSASIAQVHRAELLDGTPVAVKVRRPGIVEQMAEDIMLMKHALALAAFSPEPLDSMVLTADGFVAELERTTSDELDFRVELANLERFHREVAGQPGVTSPLPYPAFSSDDVLVMEYVEGEPIDRAARARPELAADLGRRVAESYIAQVVDNGFFHADPHPGNILVHDGAVIWIDLGMAGTLTGSERALVNKAFQAVATRDVYGLKEALVGLAKANGPVDHGLLMSQIAAMLAQYGSSDLSDIDVGQALVDVVEILRAHNLVVKPSVTLLARGFVTLEGVLAEVAPDVDVVGIVSDHVSAQLGDTSSLRRRLGEVAVEAAKSAEAAAGLPRQASDSLTMLNRGQLKVGTDLSLPEGFMSQLSSIVGTLALSFISAGLFIGSSVLCTTDLRPRVWEVPVLGILGYLGAFVLSVYVLVRARGRRRK